MNQEKLTKAQEERKAEIINGLTKDPKLSSDYIENFAQLQIIAESVGFNKALDCSKLTEAAQIYTLIPLIEKHVTYPLSELLSGSYNSTQMSLISVAYSNIIGKDEFLKPLLNPEIPYIKLNYIVKGLIEGYMDMINYIDYDADQICEIYAGYADDADVSKYVFKEVSSNLMFLCRAANSMGFNYELSEDKKKVIIG